MLAATTLVCSPQHDILQSLPLILCFSASSASDSSSWPQCCVGFKGKTAWGDLPPFHMQVSGPLHIGGCAAQGLSCESNCQAQSLSVFLVHCATPHLPLARAEECYSFLAA